ncbi:heterokaryon incompatibility protein-domain-containing protein, partial [Bisporella sp. PMI_857]
MLIDVKERRLVKTPLRTAPKYIILSYVWGQVSQLQTTTSNLANLQEGESLATEEALLQIPRVIKDAMDITTELEEQFLWVDSLCICQDDAGSKHDQIRTMGTIYSCALATLIPLTGTDASTTLSQRRRRSDRASHQEPKAIALEQEIYNSTYAQRGWTFQERILSTRCIFFGAKEGYFACHRSCIRDGTENYESQDILPTRLRLLNPLLLGAAPDSCFTTGNGTSDQQFEIYMNIVQSYTAKNFTYPGDILPAFDGICEVLRGRFRWTMHLGLPQNFLFQSLLWTTNSERQQATFYGHSDSTQYRIPSWTWAGWA